MSNFEDFMISETVQANSQIRTLLAERDSLKSENDQLRGVLSLILIYPNVDKHLGSELINLAHAALAAKEQP